MDFVDAYKHFSDSDWDGDPIDEIKIIDEKSEKKKVDFTKEEKGTGEGFIGDVDIEPKRKLKIKLRDGKAREIQHMISTSFWSASGQPISVEEFLNNIFGDLPEFFKSEKELREIWSNPTTRQAFLDKMAQVGYGKDELESLQKIVDAENSDIFDVLAYISFAIQPVSREKRVANAKSKILEGLDEKQKEFLEFVLDKYIDNGVDELGEEKLPWLLNLKYRAIADAVQKLGDVDSIRSTFFGFQKSLYAKIK